MNDLDALLQAFEQQNYVRAAQLALPLAAAGDVTAQEIMGNIYQLGLCGEWESGQGNWDSSMRRSNLHDQFRQ
jgi:hypothetical protein